MSKRRLMKKLIEYGLLVICLIPLFSINIKSSHDWGDDFAQYLHQAQNLNAGISQNETGYVFNENCFTGPQAYPVGYPILLSPILKVYGLDFYYLNLYQSLFLFLSCFMGFIILREHTAFFTAFFTSIIIAYNPVLLNFKTEIISDLPFTFFSMCCVYLMTKKSNMVLSLILGVLIGFSIHLRSVGILLLLVFVFNRLFLENNIRAFSLKQHLHTLVTIVLCAIVYLSLLLAFPCQTNYPSLFETQHFWQVINDHFSYNLHHLSMFFRGFAHANYWWIGILASCALIAFSIIGCWHFYRQHQKSVYVYYSILYLMAVISYKYSHAGMRFLFPILFFIFLFAIKGLKKNLEGMIRQQKWLALLLGLLIVFSYQEEIERMQQNQKSVLDGPQLKESQDLFQFVNSQLPENSVIAFDKPRALTLYCKVKSFSFYPASTDLEIERDIQKFNAGYYLCNQTQSAEAIKNYPLKDSLRFQLYFSNDLFKLYKINFIVQ